MKPRRLVPPLVAFSVYTLLALVFTYPLSGHLTEYHVGEDGGDARIYVWNLWWVDQALTKLHVNPLETDRIFHPVGVGLSLHTLGLLQGVFFIPLKAVFGPVAGANLIILWTFVASGLAMYALARYLGASSWGAFLAGVIYGYCPFRLARLAGHYDLLGTEWVPLYTLAFLAALRAERLRWGWILGAAALAAATGYTALNYLAFLGFVSVLAVGRELWKPSASRAQILAVCGSVSALAAFLLSPLLLQMVRDLMSWTYPPYPGSDRYAANVLAYLVPSPRQSLLGPWIGRSFDRNLTETTVFPGYLVLGGLLAAWLVRPIRREHRFWFVAAAIFFILSLGSRLRVGTWESGLPLPYTVIDRVPLLYQLRAPSRFSILVMLSLAVIFSTVWSAWMKRLTRPSIAAFATGAALLVLVAEYLSIPAPLFKAGAEPMYSRIAGDPGDFTVVEIPGIEQIPGQLMYHQTLHGKRIFIGTVARVPREKLDYFFGLHLVRPLVDLRKGKITLTRDLVEQERAVAPQVARFLGIRYIVVDRTFLPRGVADFLTQVLPVEVALEDERRILLRVREDDLPEIPWSIDAGAVGSRMAFESGWSLPEEDADHHFRWSDARRSTILLRRPSGDVHEVELSISPLEGTQQIVRFEWNGSILGTAALRPGWNRLSWALPPWEGKQVERLEILWSELRRASDRDPRHLAARVSNIRFQ